PAFPAKWGEADGSEPMSVSIQADEEKGVAAKRRRRAKQQTAQTSPLLSSTGTITGEQAHTALLPVWRMLPADLETPVSAYLKLVRGRYGYLLESVEGGERLARYSYVGADPYLVLRVRDGAAEYHWLAGPRAGMVERVRCVDPLEAVRAELERRPLARRPCLPRFSGG